MIKIIMTVLLVILFIFTGKIIQGLKKLISLITSNFMKLLSIFGIKVSKKEKTIETTKEFKEAYKDIRIVKLSKKSLKQVSSIDWAWLTIFIVGGLLVLLNMKFIWGTNPISNWIFSIIKNLKFVKSEIDMNTLYTATLFSVLSFSASKVLQRWKDTKQVRLEAKEAKLKKHVLNLMDSKELLEAAKKKDEINYKEAKGE